MASIKVLGSSSKGNCYLLDCDGEVLIIELGVDFSEVIKELDYGKRIKDVVGCLVSHEHGDHSRYIKQAQKYALSLYSCMDTASKYSGVIALNCEKKYKIGTFKVMPLSVSHSCQCFAYIIEHKDMGKMLFATDLMYFPYKIKDVNHFLIEANYDEDILIDNHINAEEGQSSPENHMSIDDCIGAIELNYSPSLQNIVLLHLSGTNADAERFKERVSSEFATDNVFVAEKGLEIELKESEF